MKSESCKKNGTTRLENVRQCMFHTESGQKFTPKDLILSYNLQ